MKGKLMFGSIAVMIMAVILTGCSKTETADTTKTADTAATAQTATIQNVSELKDKVIGLSEPAASLEKIKLMVTQTIGADPKEIVYFRNTSNAVTGLITGKIDAVLSPPFVSDYYAKRNEKLKVVEIAARPDVSVIMAVRSEDQQLKDSLDKAIATLKENGILKKLEDEWISNLPANNEPSNKDILKIEGAKTVYIGVSGDMAPLDYVAADGRPAGFNVALLTEIGKLANINFEFVSIESKARFIALSSKKIDVIFCHFQADNAAFLEELKNNNWTGTNPYYTFKGLSYLVRK